MELYRPKLIEEKASSELKSGIIQALRELMVSGDSLLTNENKIRKIQISKFILDERKVGIYPEVDALERQTSWKFLELFEDCIAYPDTPIYRSKYYSVDVKDNAICDICDEYVDDLKHVKLKICNDCLSNCKNSLETKQTLEHCFLFQTPEEDYWCKHANEKTMLLSTSKYGLKNSLILCLDCLTEEFQKRRI